MEKPGLVIVVLPAAKKPDQKSTRKSATITEARKSLAPKITQARILGSAGGGVLLVGGRGEIRTHDTLAGMPVFKTGALNRSATLP